MYCQECGTKLPATAKFCIDCGTKVWTEGPAEEIKESEAEREEIAEEDITEDAVTEEAANDMKTDFEAEQADTSVEMLKRIVKKTGKVKKTGLIVIIASVFAFLAVCFFFGKLEKRTLFTLVNPELFFGECTRYHVDDPAPRESMVSLYFESETDMSEKVAEYADLIRKVDPDLHAEVNDKPGMADKYGEMFYDRWRYFGDALWPKYSIELLSRAVSLTYYEEDGRYVVELVIRGYQNCEFLDINPYDRENSEENTSDDTTVATNAPTPTETAGTPAIPKGEVTVTSAPTPKPQAKATVTSAPSKTQDLIAEEIDVATAVQPPKNAFQNFASWGMGAVVSADAEQSDSNVQYMDYLASQETVDAYIEMLLQNGFTLVDDYYNEYRGDVWASWALNCDYVPDAGKVEMVYKNSTASHLCIYTADGEYTFFYSSDLTQYDLGLRKDGSVVNATAVKGPSAGAGLYRSADGVYTTTDGRISASMNKATIIRDGKKDVCTARSEIKNAREWLWVEDYYRNEAICFGVLQDYTMAGDLYQLQDLKREKYFNDDKDVYFYKWGDQPIFEMTVDGDFTGPLVTAKNKFKEVTVRVMYYEEGEEAVYYIYAKTSGTPSEIEVLCAVGLNVEEAENDAENAIVLSVGETHTLSYYANVFGARSEVYSWSISGGDGIYADGTGSSCKVTAMKKGTGKVTVTCIYTVEVADILTGNPTTEQRSKSKTWYFKVE